MAEYGLGQEKDYNLAQEFYQKVLDGAENGIWEEQNAYPAKIAIAKVGLKAILGEYSFVDSLVDYF